MSATAIVMLLLFFVVVLGFAIDWLLDIFDVRL